MVHALVGIEPTHTRAKAGCLTAWLQGKVPGAWYSPGESDTETLKDHGLPSVPLGLPISGSGNRTRVLPFGPTSHSPDKTELATPAWFRTWERGWIVPELSLPRFPQMSPGKDRDAAAHPPSLSAPARAAYQVVFGPLPSS